MNSKFTDDICREKVAIVCASLNFRFTRKQDQVYMMSDDTLLPCFVSRQSTVSMCLETRSLSETTGHTGRSKGTVRRTQGNSVNCCTRSERSEFFTVKHLMKSDIKLSIQFDLRVKGKAMHLSAYFK